MPRASHIFNLSAQGAKVSKQSAAHLYPQAGKVSLPTHLSVDPKRYGGSSKMTVSFHADPGQYSLELETTECYLRQVRPGSNLRWDGSSQRMTSKGLRKYKLDYKLIRQWIESVESQVEAKSPVRCDLDFWSVDEYVNQPMTSLYTVHLDEREIGLFAEHFPRYTLKGKDRFRKRIIIVPIVIESNGTHVIKVEPRRIICPKNPKNIWHRYSSQRIDVSRMSLKSQKLKIPKHPLIQSKSRQFPMDYWGWEMSLFYQRFNEDGATPKQLEASFKDSFYHGANYVNLYLTDCNYTVCPGYAGVIPWPEVLNIEGKADYQHNDQTRWNAENLKRLNRSAHVSGLSTSWYTHLPHSPNHYEVPSKWMMAFTRVLLEQFASLNTLSASDRIDGLLYETAGFAVDTDMLLLHECLWSINPSLYIAESGNEATRLTMGLLPGGANYFTCQGWPRDDTNPDLAHFDARWAQSPYGTMTHFGQLNSRDRKYSKFYGDIGPDAIIKQLNDYLRIHLDPSQGRGRASGAEWINENTETTSPEAQKSVYAVNGDPLYGAVATQMKTFGEGGWQEQAQRRQHQSFWYRKRQTETISHHDYYLQNNYLRAYVRAGSDANALLFDTSATSHYDSDAPKLTLADAFVTSVTESSCTLKDKHIEITDHGPYQASLIERIVLSLNESAGTKFDKPCEVHETRIYHSLADMPMMRVEIKRNFRGAQPDTASVMSFTGYDQLQQGSYHWKTCDGHIDHPFNAKPLIVRDSTGLRPTLCLIPHANKSTGPSVIRWQPGEGLGFWWNNPLKQKLGIGDKNICPVSKNAQQLALDLIILGPLYSEKDIPKLSKLWRHARSDEPQNRSGLPLVKVLSLPRDELLPVLVKEGRWWSFRGVQPQGDRDLVKAYLPSNARAKVMRWGFIEDAVRPGPGAQYMVNLSDVRKTKHKATFDARVNSQARQILPRVEMSQKIRSAQLNGKPWLCFEDCQIALPKQEGVYSLIVEFGQPVTPHIIATHAVIKRTTWQESTLTFEAHFPSYTRKLPRSAHFYAAIATQGRKIKNITNGSLAREAQGHATIKFKKGLIKVNFHDA